MIGAIIGDIIGSRYEFDNKKSKKFSLFSLDCFFTDDTVMTVAIGNALIQCLGNYTSLSLYTIENMKSLGKLYPAANYGLMFHQWLFSEDTKPYESFGNGAPMRVSACGIIGKNIDEVKKLSKSVTEVTHNHPEALMAAESVAVAIHLARIGKSKREIYEFINLNYYTLDFTLDQIRASYQFTEKASKTVPVSLVAFFESVSFEDAIRNAISVGGDSDTIAAITGSIAAEYYGVPLKIKAKAKTYLNEYLNKSIGEFETLYPSKITNQDTSINDAIFAHE